MALAALLTACGPVQLEPTAWDCTRIGSVCTVAGTGAHGFDGDGQKASKTLLYFPTAVRFEADGSPLVVDFNNLRIRRIGKDNRIETVAGSGFHAFAIEGDARLSPLENPIDAWPTPEGGFVVTELHAARVLEVSAAGDLTILAGTGELGFRGDGGPASEALLSEAVGISVGPDRRIYLADTDNHRIRTIDRDTGIIDTLVGTGEAGSLDGSLDTAQLGRPQQLAWIDGDLLVADAGTHQVRRIDLVEGRVTTVAGIGQAGHGGDGGPATQAMLNEPQGVAAGPDGSIWIADTGNHAIRRVWPDGTIETAVGYPGSPGDGPRGGPVSEGALNMPIGVSVGPQGLVWIVDTLNSQIRTYRPD